MAHRNLDVRGDDVYLNGERVARLIPGIDTSNRYMLRRFLEDVEHIDAHRYSRAEWPRAETGHALVRA